MRLVEVGDIELEVYEVGTGDPVVLVQTALTADELAPLAEQLDVRGGYRDLATITRSSVAGPPGPS